MSEGKRKHFTRLERAFLAALSAGFFVTSGVLWYNAGVSRWAALFEAAGGVLFAIAAVRGWVGAPWSDRLGESREARG